MSCSTSLPDVVMTMMTCRTPLEADFVIGKGQCRRHHALRVGSSCLPTLSCQRAAASIPNACVDMAPRSQLRHASLNPPTLTHRLMAASFCSRRERWVSAKLDPSIPCCGLSGTERSAGRPTSLWYPLGLYTHGRPVKFGPGAHELRSWLLEGGHSVAQQLRVIMRSAATGQGHVKSRANADPTVLREGGMDSCTSAKQRAAT